MEPLKRGYKVAKKQLTGNSGYPETKYGTWLYGLNELRQTQEKRYESGQQGAGLALTQMQAAPKILFPFQKQNNSDKVVCRYSNIYPIDYSNTSNKQQHDTDFAARYVGVVVNFFKGHLR